MSIKKGEIARCGACRFYTPTGRRGGECSQFGVHVQSVWKTCSLAKSPFQKLTNVSSSEIDLTAEIDLTKVAQEKQVASEPLPMPSNRFSSSEKPLVVKIAQ